MAAPTAMAPTLPMAFGAQASPGKPPRPWFKKKRYLIPAGIVALVIIGSTMSGGGDTTTSTQSSTSSPSASASQPGSSASPSETPKESTAPTSNAYDETFGAFAVMSKSGRGDSTLRLPKGASAGVVTFSHKGSSNVSLQVLDARNQSTGDLLVNDIGSYSGVTAYGLSDLGGDPVKLKISADGSWNIKIAPVSTAPRLGSSASGKGDRVFRYDGDAVDFAITHKGSANFVVMQAGGAFPNLAVNEIGSYRGTVPFEEGPSVVTFTADGTWTLKRQ